MSGTQGGSIQEINDQKSLTTKKKSQPLNETIDTNKETVPRLPLQKTIDHSATSQKEPVVLETFGEE